MGDVGVHDEPTVLLVGTGERLAPAIAARLRDHGIAVESASPHNAAQVAFAAAPDLVVLAGTAAEDGGLDVVTALAQRAVTATLPVALIVGEARPRSSSFRHGVVAIIERSASADQMAREIAALAHELPERSGESAGALQRASVDELVQLFADSLRSGILSVSKGDGGPSAQVLLHADRPVQEVIEQLVERLKPLVADAGELQYEFHESAPSRIASLDVSDGRESSPALLRDRRVLVIEQNAARSDRLGQELRSAGAIVVVADGSGSGLELARDLMPEVVVVDGSGVEGWAIEALRQIRRDPCLRWASLLLVDSTQLWRDPRRPDVALLVAPITAHVAPDRDLASRAQKGDELGTRLEMIGPTRTLRALVETRRTLRVTVRHPRVVVEIDLADGLVAGATAREPRASRTVAEGAAALSTLLGLASGRVHVAPADAPRTANLMAPLDDAIAASREEKPAIAPSLPPPSLAPARAPTASPPAEDVDALVTRLENLLAQLRAEPELGSEEPTRRAPSELPTIAEAGDSDTGNYDPALVRQLRARMRRSSQNLAAVREGEPESAPARPAEPPPANAPPRAAQPTKRAPRKKVPTLVLGSAADASPTKPAAPPPARIPRPAAPLRPLPPKASSAELPKAPKPPLAEPPLDDARASAPGSAAEAAASMPAMLHAAETARPPPPVPAITEEIAHGGAPAAPAVVAPEPGAPAAPPIAAPEPELLTHGVESAPPPAPASEAEALEAELASRFQPPIEAPARRSSGLPLKIALFGAPLVLASVGLGVWLVFLRGDDEPVAVLPTTPPAASEETTPPAPPREPAPREPAPREPSLREPSPRQPTPSQPSPREQARSAPAGARIGPGPDDPIEGRAEDFDLARFGVSPIEPPSSRRALAARINRHIRAANTARNREQLVEAERGYQIVLGLQPENARATAGMVRIHLARNEAEPAIAFAQRLVRLHPEYASNYVLLGDALLAGNNPEAARRAFLHAAAMEPDWATARERLAALDEPAPR